jgi:hypothetical protein
VRESSILIWAAGRDADVGAGYDEELLLAAVRAHHMEIRFEHRIARDRPQWLSPATVRRVEDLAADARALARRNFSALAEVLAEADGPEFPLLSKGMTYFLLTRQDLMLKRSADLDLFSKHPEGLREVLCRMGYEVDPKDPPQPYGRKVFHEFAKLRRDDVEIDLHSRFPVWSYPPGITGTTVSPAANPGLWAGPDSMRRGQLSTGALFDSQVTATGPGETAIPVTSPEMTALVSCSHLFANYVAEFLQPYASIRLGELVNLTELISLRSFDWAVFDELTQRHDALDAVTFAMWLSRRWLAPPPSAANYVNRFGDELPPRTLWFARGKSVFLVSPFESAEDLLVRTVTAEDLADHLDAVPAMADGRWYSVLSDQTGSPVTRALIHCDGSDRLGFRFGLRSDGSGLTLTVEPAFETGGQEVDILCCFNEPIIECVAHPGGEHHAYDRLREQRLTPAEIPFRQVNGTYRITIPPARLPPGDNLPMLLGVRQWNTDGEYPRAATLVPIRIMAGP